MINGYRTLKVIKKVKLVLPNKWSTRDVSGKTVHYFEGDVQIGRITVSYSVPDGSTEIYVGYAFGRLSDKKATKQLGKDIAFDRMCLPGHSFVAFSNKPMPRQMIIQLLKLGARCMAKNEKVGWMKNNVTIL